MAILDPTRAFEIQHGVEEHDSTAAYKRDYKPSSSVSAPLTAGDICEVVSDGGDPALQLLTLPALGGGASVAALFDLLNDRKRALFVLEGMSVDESGFGFSSTCTCASGHMVIETTNFASGTYAPGSKVSVTGGQIVAVAASDKLSVGEVISMSADGTRLVFATPAA